MATKKPSDSSFVLPPLNIAQLQAIIIGDTPLIVHAWSEKAKRQMLAKQTKEAQLAKEAKDPEADFKQSLYTIKDGGYGFPSVAIKDSMVTAVTSISGVTKIAARQAFRVLGNQELVSGAHPGLTTRQDLVRILGSEPEMREDMVRIAQSTADIRYRGQFFPWCMKLHISYNENLLSGEQILNLLNVAGFAVGLGEWRAERNGQFGAFHVATKDDVPLLTELDVLDNRKTRKTKELVHA
jgi:hypothetical protein